MFDSERPVTRDSGPVTCFGMTFENDEARREHFLRLLRAGLQELREKLGVPFVSFEDTYARLKSLQYWPIGTEEQIRDLARRIARAASSTRDSRPATRDILGLYKDEVGFPHGSIEDILSLSDPPYYTACPNPFIADFLKHYGKPYDPNVPYSKEPFAADVSEGKNDPIYNAHSYHTKVPHKAIMRYILHYTEPGDVVFDGFCGTGMTGVAAQLCGDRKTVESLGYKVDEQGFIYQQETDENGKTVWKPFSKLGARRAILNDLSPAATFIAYNYNTPVDVKAFEREAKRILKEVEEECAWMYATLSRGVPGSGLSVPSDDRFVELANRIRKAKTIDEIRQIFAELGTRNQKLGTVDFALGKINYAVWSDVFVCPECTQEVIFWEVAVDKEAGKVHDQFPCPHCGAQLTKRTMDRTWVTKYDKAIGQTIRQAKQVPVLINYSVGNRRYEKAPDAFDLALIEKIEQLEIPYWFPTDRMPEGYNTEQPKVSHGLTHVHHFYTKRNLWALGALYETAGRSPIELRDIAKFFVQYACLGFSKISRYVPTHYSQVNRYLSGTLYVGSQQVEVSPVYILKAKADRMAKRELKRPYAGAFVLSTSDATSSIEHRESVDYIFTDPPFGGNLMYSELNFLWEAWLKVFTNNKPEAITNETQGKGLPEYQRLMTECFKEYYRVLKPGRWMTVEFHNSKNSVWNAIQEALQTAGFVVADVRTLDKKQGSFKQVTSASAVKQDLIISCYKPNGGLEERFKLEAGTEEGVWDFVRTHLRQLPVAVVTGRGSKVAGQDDSGLGTQDSRLEIVAERQNYLLFDRMVAFHVQRGVTVPLSAAEFYAGLAQRFPERDGMYFLPEQVAEYDKKRMKVKEVLQLQLFVTDEASAIQWLKASLTKKPQTFQELHPQFLKEIGGWQKHEKPLELSELLEQNFLRYDGKGPIPAQIVAWMKQSENLRKIIQEELAAGGATEENGQLETRNQELITRAKARWYVPDPNKAGDLEKLRERALLREFEEYRESKQKRLKVFRLEAVRAGFKKAWAERDYATIIAVARKIPENVLQEDPKLLMWYDQALTRSGEDR
ncbi:DNA methylase N-4/N-6 domain protein [Thermanaerovibrio acidaminovorans DSM 6589]|uniref:DNA methylase N-4/N-6 domain protein n=2 Tax=Thermanaerovibrio TaxID=81461 RepID=D1B6S8_THEAS|nr:DNA methylase N-4/N-6 domain protein [Thermanaerovibrio acidaminovorans DSM 6589]